VDITDESVVSRSSASPRAVHKITITEGTTKLVYWYVKGAKATRGFEKVRDMELVQLMHAKSLEMRPGRFESFSIGTGLDYHLKHLGPNEFEIEALRN
jgi:hypothetical protein